MSSIKTNELPGFNESPPIVITRVILRDEYTAGCLQKSLCEIHACVVQGGFCVIFFSRWFFFSKFFNLKSEILSPSCWFFNSFLLNVNFCFTLSDKSCNTKLISTHECAIRETNKRMYDGGQDRVSSKKSRTRRIYAGNLNHDRRRGWRKNKVAILSRLRESRSCVTNTVIHYYTSPCHYCSTSFARARKKSPRASFIRFLCQILSLFLRCNPLSRSFRSTCDIYTCEGYGEEKNLPRTRAEFLGSKGQSTFLTYFIYWWWFCIHSVVRVACFIVRTDRSIDLGTSTHAYGNKKS